MIRDVELSILEAQPARSLDHRRVGTAGCLVGKAKDPRETVLFRVEGDFLDPHGRPATITVSTFGLTGQEYIWPDIRYTSACGRLSPRYPHISAMHPAYTLVQLTRLSIETISPYWSYTS